MTARCVMVLGTTSGAGKSWVTTALCRYYARQGLKVAPFKAQNMSNNARVVPLRSGDTALGEIGAAQYFQALSARCPPHAGLNPILLKPENDQHSQVVVMGQVDAVRSAMPWHERSLALWPVVQDALDALRADNDVVVIEGAGSPVEINLMHSDIVNLKVARHAQARTVLVTDIDRGGAFAHLYGTWALMPDADRKQLAAFILNRFRGDPRLLAPAPQWLMEQTGVPMVGTLPMWREHGLPEEDGMSSPWPTPGVSSGLNAGMTPEGRPGDIKKVAIVAYPRISNLDEFEPLQRLPGWECHWARSPAALHGADWIILPGSKSTAADLAWLRAQGLDQAILAHARAGGAVLGICGGLQMLGETLRDPHGVDGSAQGLGLLPLHTTFEVRKHLQLTQARWPLDMRGPWKAWAGMAFQGYEIHQGHSTGPDDERCLIPSLAWRNAEGHVLGSYVHGMLEHPGLLQALAGVPPRPLDAVFDGLADFLQTHLPSSALDAWIQG